MIRIAISVKQKTARIALLNGDTLTEYTIWNFTEPGDIGDTYTARITARTPAMAGSFADIGDTSGFLPDSAGATGLHEGAYLAVHISRMAQGGKGPRLAAIPLACAGKPGLIRQGFGPLADLAARFSAAPIEIDNHALLARLLPTFNGRMAYKATTFDAVLEDETAALAEPTAELTLGARMHITSTAALTAIDIDAGAATGARTAKYQAQLSLNTALIPAIIRQIILRNLSGAILIDFAGIKSLARKNLGPALAAALETDPLAARLLGFSHLGFAEISRPRIRPPLQELLK